MAATPVLHYWICLHRDQLSVSHHSHGRPPAGRPACAGDLSAINQLYLPHPTLLCSLQPVGRSNYFMRLTAPQNSHSHTDRQTAQLNYIYRCMPTPTAPVHNLVAGLSFSLMTNAGDHDASGHNIAVARHQIRC